MAVAGLKGTGLPVIKLYTAASATHTITLSSWLKGLTVMDPQWEPEYDTGDARMSDSSRTIKKYLAGFRFILAIEFEDKQILSDPTSNVKREYFEYLMDLIRGWAMQGSTYTVVVYPFEDNTAIYYTCHLLEALKENTIYNGFPRSVAHKHRLVFQAVALVSAIPQQNPLPWVPPAP